MRFWFSAVALSASVMALCPTQLIHAAARMQDAYSTTATETGNAVPAMHLAQGHSPVGGGKGGGGLGGGAGMHGGGGGLGGGAGMHGGGGGLGGGAGMHGGGGGLGGGAGMHGVGGGLGGGAGMHGVGGGLGGGAGMHGVGGGLGGGPTMRTLAPGAGGRFVTPGMTPGGTYRFATPRGASRFVIYQGRATYGIRPGIAPHVPARPGVQRVSGAHYPRYRHRHRGFHHYHRGWWYAFPWWILSGPYGGSCEYWSDVCATRWGYGTRGYHSCLRYHGCY